MADIFICYSSKDRLVAQQFVALFESFGWSVFMDTHIHAGHQFHVEIEQQLNAAHAVVALWSASSTVSEYVLDEAEEAKQRNILVPALIESVRIPYGFRRRQTANLADWDGSETHVEFASVFLPALENLLGGSQTNPVEPAEKVRSTGPKTQKPTTSPPQAGDTFQDRLKNGAKGPKMVIVPAGSFLMGRPDYEKGDDDEIPQHEVTIAEPLAMGIYPVTFEEYALFASASGREMPEDEGWGKGDRPVINVTWQDAHRYCQWLSAQTGRLYQLPSEAQWEYAARAGTQTRYWWGDELGTNQAVCNGCGSRWDGKQTAPVGSFQANAYGLHDVHGTVWEWCQDRWHENYKSAPTDGSAWESGEDVRRVVRGGSWGSSPGSCRSAYRGRNLPDFRYFDVGFRLCCSSPIE